MLPYMRCLSAKGRVAQLSSNLISAKRFLTRLSTISINQRVNSIVMWSFVAKPQRRREADVKLTIKNYLLMAITLSSRTERLMNKIDAHGASFNNKHRTTWEQRIEWWGSDSLQCSSLDSHDHVASTKSSHSFTNSGYLLLREVVQKLTVWEVLILFLVVSSTRLFVGTSRRWAIDTRLAAERR